MSELEMVGMLVMETVSKSAKEWAVLWVTKSAWWLEQE
jgi:hypothetical protein